MSGYQSVDGPSGETDHSWSGLRKRTKIIIILSIILVIATVATIVTVLAVKDEENKKHHHEEKVCILNEVKDNPPAPSPERIQLQFVPLPPVSPSNDPGACSTEVNPRGTGCMDGGNMMIQSGSFLPDGNHAIVSITFSGSSPSSIYSGYQVIIVKVDGTTFSNGDSWKCITCGVPQNNSQGFHSGVYDYPQSFSDGKRILAGTNIIDCSPFYLHDDQCSPDNTFIYPLIWSGGNIRELRLHPNNTYLGFNVMFLVGNTISQFGAFGSISFQNISSSPHYAVNNVTILYDPSPETQMIHVNPKNSSEIIFNPNATGIGEFRGFSKDGTEILWIGQPVESGNFDIMGTSITSGITRRLTRNQEYTDPVDMSPDNGYIVVMDTRGSNRLEFAAGMRGIPPLIDFVTTSTVASIRNNGDRRFFEPYLIDKYGDRGDYQGQKLTADGVDFNNSNWNGMADPRWSPDGTKVIFWQSLVTSPACGGVNPLICPNSTEPGERRTRVIVANLLDRQPISPYPPLPPVPEQISWGTPFVSVSSLPSRYSLPDGSYTLKGNFSGTAFMSLTSNASSTTVSVKYNNYSDDGYFVIDGNEYAQDTRPSPMTVKLFWKSNLTLSGCEKGKKYTTDNGYTTILNIMDASLPMEAVGTLSTTIGGVTYVSPNSGT